MREMNRQISRQRLLKDLIRMGVGDRKFVILGVRESV